MFIDTSTPDAYWKWFNKVKSHRESYYDTHWQDIADFTLPSREYIRYNSPGQRRNTNIYDSTALQANEQLAATLHMYLTPPGGDWFNLSVVDGGRLSHQDQMWLDQASEIMRTQFRKERSRFSTASFEFYLELAAIGNAVLVPQLKMPTRQDQSVGITFRALPMDSCYFVVNDQDQVDTLFYHMKLSAYEARSKFNERTPKKILEAIEKDPRKEFEFLHVVHPSQANEKTEKPYRSVYIFKDDKEEFIQTGGFEEFPFMATRWSKRSGEDYGFGPGGQSLPTTMMVNDMMEVTIRAAEKIVDPPLLVPNDTAIHPVVIDPGSQINYDPSSEPISTLEMKGRPDIATDLIQMHRTSINEMFYVPFMNMANRPQMTATEVAEYRQQSLGQLSPVLARLQSEYTGPMIERTFGLMVRAGLIPPAPPSLGGREIKVEYTSPLSAAQKQSEVESIMRTHAIAMTLAQADPLVMENFDTDATLRHIALNVNNIDTKTLKPAEAVQGIRQQAAQAQQQAAAQQQLANQAAASKDISQGAKNIQNAANQ